MAAAAGLAKSERLTFREDIQDLFSGENQKVGKFPLLVLYKITDQTVFDSHKVMFSVSKRKFGKAVDRNRLKRLMREAYRTCERRSDLRLASDKQIHLAFIYTGKGSESYIDINKAIKKIHDVLIERIAESN